MDISSLPREHTRCKILLDDIGEALPYFLFRSFPKLLGWCPSLLELFGLWVIYISVFWHVFIFCLIIKGIFCFVNWFLSISHCFCVYSKMLSLLFMWLFRVCFVSFVFSIKFLFWKDVIFLLSHFKASNYLYFSMFLVGYGCWCYMLYEQWVFYLNLGRTLS